MSAEGDEFRRTVRRAAAFSLSTFRREVGEVWTAMGNKQWWSDENTDERDRVMTAIGSRFLRIKVEGKDLETAITLYHAVTAEYARRRVLTWSV
jgi:hypothetical protein